MKENPHLLLLILHNFNWDDKHTPADIKKYIWIENDSKELEYNKQNWSYAVPIYICINMYEKVKSINQKWMNIYSR